MNVKCLNLLFILIRINNANEVYLNFNLNVPIAEN